MISPQVNVKSFQEKRVVTVFGYEIILRSTKKKGNEEEEDEDEGNRKVVEMSVEGEDKSEADNEKDADEGDMVLFLKVKGLKFYC